MIRETSEGKSIFCVDRRTVAWSLVFSVITFLLYSSKEELRITLTYY